MNLKPCPFCDGEAIKFTNAILEERIYCQSCGVTTDSYQPKFHRVEDYWNQRADQPINNPINTPIDINQAIVDRLPKFDEFHSACLNLESIEQLYIWFCNQLINEANP